MHYTPTLLDYSVIPYDNAVIMFTGNRIVTKAGNLVMGGGNALACARGLPQTPRMFGKLLAERTMIKAHNMFLPHPLNPRSAIGVMFTKDHYKNPSELAVVIEAIANLKLYALLNPELTFHLPYPGCGLGGLTREDLDKHVEALPDNVYVYVV